MGKVEFSIDQTPADIRSNEVSISLKITNSTDKIIEIQDIIPIFPSKSILKESGNPNTISQKESHTILCKELSTILQHEFFIKNEDIRKIYALKMVEAIESAFKKARNPILIILQYPLINTIKQYSMEVSSYFIKIDNYIDAESAFKKFILTKPQIDGENNQTYNYIQDIFEEKMQKLKIIEEQIGPNTKNAIIIEIQPEYSHSVSYLLEFPRDILNAKNTIIQ